jgi:hypothetical protein
VDQQEEHAAHLVVIQRRHRIALPNHHPSTHDRYFPVPRKPVGEAQLHVLCVVGRVNLLAMQSSHDVGGLLVLHVHVAGDGIPRQAGVLNQTLKGASDHQQVPCFSRILEKKPSRPCMCGLRSRTVSASVWIVWPADE